MRVRGLLLFLPLTLALSPWARGDEKLQRWLEVRSPHFIVASNAGEKKTRRVAKQFEFIREVFRKTFPAIRQDTGQPLIILAVKDEKSLRALLPGFWKKKGQARPAGIFVGGPEKQYVALRIDAPGPRPYHAMYHEYYHLLTSRSHDWLPLWLAEGLAEFYASTIVQGERVLLGAPNEPHVRLLRSQRLLPLDVLFTVDHSSPYYSERRKASIFYAQSWAFIHYVLIRDWKNQTSLLVDYLQLLRKDVAPQQAAQRAFGDLRQLEKALQQYIRRASFSALPVRVNAKIDEKKFALRELSPAESATFRGDFLLHMGRLEEARALLEEAVGGEPDFAPAHESMGWLALREGKREEATKSLARALQLDSRSFLANYYLGMLLTSEPQDQETLDRTAEALQRSVQLNPNFAPALSALASLHASRKEKLNAARRLAHKAIALEPGVSVHYLNLARVLAASDQTDQALKIGQRALILAKTPRERAQAEQFLQFERQHREQQHEAARKGYELGRKQVEKEIRESLDEPTGPTLRRRK